MKKEVARQHGSESEVDIENEKTTKKSYLRIRKREKVRDRKR